MPGVKKFSRRKANPTPCKRKAQSPAKHKQWTDLQMLESMEAVSSGNVSINKASEMYGVTLKDRLSGRVVHGTKPDHILHRSEES